MDGLAASRGGGGEDPIGRRLLNELLVQMSSLAAGAAGAAGQGQRATREGAGPARAAGGGAGGSRTAPDGDGVCRVYVFAATNRMQVGGAAQRTGALRDSRFGVLSLVCRCSRSRSCILRTLLDIRSHHSHISLAPLS